MAKQVPYQIRFVAFARNHDGTHSVMDIVETSYHHASYFARKFRRDNRVSHFTVNGPNAPLNSGVTWHNNTPLMAYGILWTDTRNGRQELCETHKGVVYEYGTRKEEENTVARLNSDAKDHMFPSHYRIVPLPWVG